MNKEANDSLLLHQFVAGLSGMITKEFRASGKVKTLKGVVIQARILITVDSQPLSTAGEVAEK